MTNMFRLDGKVAVIIGGTGTIGAAMADGLARYGAKVVIASRNLMKLRIVAEKIQNYAHSTAKAYQVDVTDENSVARLVEQVLHEFGTIDILVNSQKSNIKQPATEFTVKDWDTMFHINVRGTMLTCREFGKIMIKNRKGKIINFSSVCGNRATLRNGNEGYAATKSAVDMITRSLASEWAPFNINVNAIAPATILAPSFEGKPRDPEQLQRYIVNIPLKRVGEPDDLVGACVFLASPASDFITGQILYLDGGMTAIG